MGRGRGTEFLGRGTEFLSPPMGGVQNSCHLCREEFRIPAQGGRGTEFPRKAGGAQNSRAKREGAQNFRVKREGRIIPTHDGGRRFLACDGRKNSSVGAERGHTKFLCLTKQVKCFSICSMPLPIVFMFECIMNTKCIMNTECIIRLNM